MPARGAPSSKYDVVAGGVESAHLIDHSVADRPGFVELVPTMSRATSRGLGVSTRAIVGSMAGYLFIIGLTSS